MKRIFNTGVGSGVARSFDLRVLPEPQGVRRVTGTVLTLFLYL